MPKTYFYHNCANSFIYFIFSISSNAERQVGDGLMSFYGYWYDDTTKESKPCIPTDAIIAPLVEFLNIFPEPLCVS